jgi:hypothetical protein
VDARNLPKQRCPLRNAIYSAGEMTEERKHAILFAATILCARKLIDIIDSDKPNFAKGFFVDKAIEEAVFILERIDKKWPTTSETGNLKTQSA